MRLAHALLVSHALVLVFCVMGIAIALPNPQLWANDPRRSPPPAPSHSAMSCWEPAPASPLAPTVTQMA